MATQWTVTGHDELDSTKDVNVIIRQKWGDAANLTRIPTSAVTTSCSTLSATKSRSTGLDTSYHSEPAVSLLFRMRRPSGPSQADPLSKSLSGLQCHV